LIGTLFKVNVILTPFLVPAGCSPKTIAGCHIASVADLATRIDPDVGAELPLIETVDVAVSNEPALTLLLSSENSN